MTGMQTYPPLITKLSEYVPTVTKDQLVWVIGKLLTETRISLRDIQKKLKVTREQSEEIVGFILQSNLIDARVIKNELILNKKPQLETGDGKDLRKRHKRLLGFLKLREKLVWEELEWIFKEDIKTLEADIYSLAIKGYLKLSQRENWLLPVVRYQAEPINHENVTLEQKNIIGLATMLQIVPVETLAEHLDLPSYRIIDLFSDLAIANAVIARIHIESSLFKRKTIILECKGFTINFPHRSVSILETDEKLVIGYVYLRKKIRFKHLSEALEIPEQTLIRILANLTATNTFKFSLTPDMVVSPAENIDFQPVRSIDDISMLSLFNYHMLLGMLSSLKTVSIKNLAIRMNEPEFEVLRGLITLTLEGFIKGYLTEKEVFVLTEVRETSPTHQKRNLQEWEKIAIGYLTTKTKVNIKDLAKILGISPRDALQKAYSLQVRKQFEGEIVMDRTIIVQEVPSIPPLIQPEELSEKEKIILGYLYTHPKTHLKDLQKILPSNENELQRTIYKLIGLGLVRLREEKKKFELLHRPTIQPSKTIDELDGIQKFIAKIIEDGPPPPTIYNLNRLAELLHLTTKEATKKLYILVAEGYYNGTVEKGRFHLRGIQEVRLGKPICLNCHQELENPKEPCPHCGAPPAQCSVCKGIVISTEPLLKCPHCHQPAHASHIKEWLKIKSECPYCRQPLRESDLEPVI